MKTYGVIMAGGGGSRFWPLSRKARPKQFLNLTGRDLMVNETIDRLEGIADKGDIYVVTGKAYARLTREETAGRLEDYQILAEPAARNTAACIGYAAMEIVRKHGDGVMCVLSSDHYIRDVSEFRRVLSEAVALAGKDDTLVTIGITPTFPSTGYGYIRRAEDGISVEEFVEKPDRDTAKAYIETGRYLWNSGMFVWKASVILDYFKKLLPDIYACLEKIGEAMDTPSEYAVRDEIYPTIPKISIDYGIMERADRVKVLAGDFGWDDIGSWETMSALHEADSDGNITVGESLIIDAKNCIAHSSGKLVALLGVSNLVVADAGDIVLVCDRSRAQDVKKIVEELEKQGNDRFL